MAQSICQFFTEVKPPLSLIPSPKKLFTKNEQGGGRISHKFEREGKNLTTTSWTPFSHKNLENVFYKQPHKYFVNFRKTFIFHQQDWEPLRSNLFHLCKQGLQQPRRHKNSKQSLATKWLASLPRSKDTLLMCMDINADEILSKKDLRYVLNELLIIREMWRRYENKWNYVL
jgi:hypothetical protein